VVKIGRGVSGHRDDLQPLGAASQRNAGAGPPQPRR